jgi:hypothetical protein
MRGYPTMEDDLRGFQEADLDEVRILVSNDEIAALSSICHRSAADHHGRKFLHKQCSEIPRQLFEVARQAAVGGKLIARENICSLSKDVTAKCHGSDITRERKVRMKPGRRGRDPAGGHPQHAVGRRRPNGAARAEPLHRQRCRSTKGSSIRRPLSSGSIRKVCWRSS